MKKKVFLVVAFLMILIPINVKGLTVEDDSMQSICNDADATSRITYTLDNGEIRHLFCNNAFDDWFTGTEICNDDGKLTIGDSICLNRETKTITLNNFKGSQLYIGEIDIDGDGIKDDLTLIYKGENVITTTDDVLHTAAFYSATNLIIKDSDSSDSLTINANVNPATVESGLRLSDGEFSISSCSNLNINLNTVCSTSNMLFNGIKVTNGTLMIEKSKVNINVKKGSENCADGKLYQGFGITGINSDIIIGQDDNGTDTMVNINTDLGGVMITGSSDAKASFEIEEDISDSKEKDDYGIRSTKLTVNYNATDKDQNLFYLDNVIFKIEGMIQISPLLIGDDGSPTNDEITNPVVMNNTTMDFTTDGIFAILSDSAQSIKATSSKLELDGLLHLQNTNENGIALELVDSTLNENESALKSENLNIEESTSDTDQKIVKYTDSEILWNFGNKMVSNEGNGVIKIYSPRAFHYGYVNSSNKLDIGEIVGLDTTNILDYGYILLGKNSDISDQSKIFGLPKGTTENPNLYKVLIEVPANLNEEAKNVVTLYTLNDGTYTKVREVTAEIGTQKEIIGTSDYSNLTYYVIDLTADEISSGLYFTLTATGNNVYFKDKETGIVIYPPETLPSDFTFEVNNNFEDSIKEKIQTSIEAMGIQSIKLQDLYTFDITNTGEELPGGKYKVKIPSESLDKNSTLQIYAYDSNGNKIDQNIIYSVEDGYYTFEIDKSDLGNTIYAITTMNGKKSFADSSYRLITSSPIYDSCVFKAVESSGVTNNGEIQKDMKFDLDCGNNYTLPNITYSIEFEKPESRDDKVKMIENASGNNVQLKVIFGETKEYLNFDIRKNDLGNTTYSLLYKKVCEEITQTKFTIIFNTDGGNSISDIIVDKTTEGVALPIPTKSGFVFKGWKYADDTLVDVAKTTDIKHTTVAVNDQYGCPTEKYEAVTLYAIWEKEKEEPITCEEVTKTFNLKYNTNGGNEIAEEKITLSSNDTLPTPSKEGYNFEGWYYDETLTSLVTLSAKKSELTTKEIKNDLGCITGYEDVILYAKWTNNACQEYNGIAFNVIFNTNGGTAIEKKSTSTTLPPENLPTPTKEGYTFEGWYYDSNLTKKVNVTVINHLDFKVIDYSDDGCVKTVEDVVLYAKWNKNSDTITCDDPEIKITIKYNENGGVDISNNENGYITEFKSLVSTTKDGYIFSGWYYDTDLTEKVTEDNWKSHLNEVPLVNGESNENSCLISKDGTLNLYAKWTVEEIKEPHTIVSSSGDKIYNELIDSDGDYDFSVDRITQNSSSFVDGIEEAVKKAIVPKELIDIYRFNLNSDTETLPGGKYVVKIPITKEMRDNYEELEVYALDSTGKLTDRKLTLTRDGDYYTFEVEKEDLGSTMFALIGNKLVNPDTGSIFKFGVFGLLVMGCAVIFVKAKKKNKIFKI